MGRTGMKAKQLGKIVFFLLGISSLVSWNSILTALDYFSEQYPDQNVTFYYAIPMYLGTNIFSVAVLKLAQVSSLETRMYGCIVTQSVLNVSLPITASYVSGEQGFYLQLFLIFLLGSANAICQSTGVAFASIFVRDNYITYFFTGTGFSGIILAVFRSGCILAFGLSADGNRKGTLVYFSFASFIQLVSMVNMEIFKRSAYSQYHIRWAEQRTITKTITDIVGSIVVGPNSCNKSFLKQQRGSQSSGSLDDSLVDSEIGEGLPQIDQLENEFAKSISQLPEQCPPEQDQPIAYQDPQDSFVSTDSTPENLNKRGLKFILVVFRKVWINFIMIFLNYMICFLVFPGVSTMKVYFGMEAAWNITFIVLIFNTFDTIGKMTTAHLAFTRRSATWLVIFRLVFVGTFICVACLQSNTFFGSDYFALINLALFSFTGGYACSAHMVLAPNACKTQLEKETASFIMTFPLFLGILTGSLTAVTLSGINK